MRGKVGMTEPADTNSTATSLEDHTEDFDTAENPVLHYAELYF